MIERLTHPSDARLVAMFGSAVLHATVFGLAGAFEPPRPLASRPTARVSEIEIETVAKEMPPAEPIAVEPVEPARASPPLRRARPAPTPAEPAPAAAALATADAHAAATTDTMVSGTAATPPNGPAAAEGTATTPVVVAARAPASTQATSGVSDGPDRSRAPRLAGTTEWSCPFPIEADSADVDRAIVTLRVEVARDGSVVRTAALDDPGHGFARQAQRCALRKRWAPGLDRAGQPAPATAVVRVRFER
jgi:protein TonB